MKARQHGLSLLPGSGQILTPLQLRQKSRCRFNGWLPCSPELPPIAAIASTFSAYSPRHVPPIVRPTAKQLHELHDITPGEKRTKIYDTE